VGRLLGFMVKRAVLLWSTGGEKKERKVRLKESGKKGVGVAHDD